MDIIKINDASLCIADKDILNSVSLTIKEGETLAIIGPSGAGKSSLLKIINGLWHPYYGTVEVDGTEITHLREHELNTVRQKIAVVFQSNALFDSLTVEDNVAFFLRENTSLPEEEILERVYQELCFVNLVGTEKLEVNELSGGMKKRVAIARALAIKPKIILFDEPTAGLDPITSKLIIGLVKNVKTLGATSVIVTHTISNAFEVADRIAVVNNGEIITVSTPEELKTSDDKFIKEFISDDISVATEIYKCD